MGLLGYRIMKLFQSSKFARIAEGGGEGRRGEENSRES